MWIVFAIAIVADQMIAERQKDQFHILSDCVKIGRSMTSGAFECLEAFAVLGIDGLNWLCGFIIVEL